MKLIITNSRSLITRYKNYEENKSDIKGFEKMGWLHSIRFL